MPYALTWLDEGQRLLALRLFNPLLEAEVERLQTEMASIVAVPGPLFVLLDIREFSVIKTINRVVDRVVQDGHNWFELSHHEDAGFCLAILGGGALITTIVGLANSLGAPPSGSQPPIQVFSYEDKALTWLRENALKLSLAAPSN